MTDTAAVIRRFFKGDALCGRVGGDEFMVFVKDVMDVSSLLLQAEFLRQEIAKTTSERNITIDGEDMVLLQTNAAINPGNSGGGLFNMAGQLIGVVNAKAGGDDVEGLGFAIPVDYAHKVIEDLINYGYVRGIVDHGLILLDVTEQNLPSAYRKYGITSVGVVILDSQYSDELEFGDTVLSINNQSIDSSSDVDLIVKSFSIGDEITISVKRGKNVIDVKMTLQEKVPEKVSFG